MGPFRRGMILLGIFCIVIISISAASAPDSTPNQAATTGTGIDVINRVWTGTDLVNEAKSGDTFIQTIPNIQADTTIRASCNGKQDFYTITPSAGPHGTITPSNRVVVRRGSSKTFLITPDHGFIIKDVLVDGTSVGPVPSYTFSEVQDDHRIRATFEKAFLTIIPSAGSHGHISPSAPVAVPRGGSQIFSITSDPGYLIKDVVVDGKSVGPVPSYTFTNVQDDRKIKATFKQTKLTFTITPSAGDRKSVV
jgi:hypothetical protein